MENGIGQSALKIVLIAAGVLALGGVSFFLLGSNSGDVLRYYDDGTLKSNFSVNSEGEGAFTLYYENGNKKEEETGTFRGNRLDGRGEMTFYYENGNKEAEIKGIFKNGILQEGDEVVYYDEDGSQIHNAAGFGIYYDKDGNKRRAYTGLRFPEDEKNEEVPVPGR